MPPMTPIAQSAIHAVRAKRLHQAVQALEAAMAQGQAVSQALLQVSGLLERGVDPFQIRTTHRDLPRLLEIARAIEAQEFAEPHPDARRPTRRMPV
jgi:hypothetical protein